MLKKILKYILRAALILAGLPVLVSALVYLPAVQNFVKRSAANHLSANMGIKLDIERFRLRFPLALAVDNTVVRNMQGDTLMNVELLRVRVALLPLLGGSVEINGFEVRNAAVDFDGKTSGMALRGRADKLDLIKVRVRLRERSVEAKAVSLDGVACSLVLSEPQAGATAADTAASESAPWKIAADRISLDRLNFDMQVPADSLLLTLDMGKVTLKKTTLDLGRQVINAGSLRIDGGVTDFRSYPGGAARQNNQSSPPWSIELGRVELAGQTITYSTRPGSPAEGFDPSHIHAEGVGARIDSFAFDGAGISADVKKLAMRERSGIGITDARGRFAVDSARIDLTDLVLRTPSSVVKADLHAELGPDGISFGSPFSLKMNASVGSRDLFAAYPADAQLRRAIDGNALTAAVDIDGEHNMLVVNSLRMAMPPYATLDADGRLSNLTDLRNISGSLRIDGRFADMGFIKEFLPSAVRNRTGFPRRMALTGSVAADRGTYSPRIAVTADAGRMDITGSFSLRNERYDARVTADNFPLGSFLPADSLGLATFEIAAAGNGFDPERISTAAKLNVKIGRFDYKGFNHSGIALNASLRDGALDGALTSDNEALRLNLSVDGRITANRYAARLKGRIDNADLMAMHLVHSPLNGSATVDISAEASHGQQEPEIYKVDAAVDSAHIVHGAFTDNIDRMTLTAFADSSAVKASVRTGDFAFDFGSPAPPGDLKNAATELGAVVSRQIAARDVNMEEVGQAVPEFSLDMTSGKNNIAHSLAAYRGISFNTLSLSAGRSDTIPLFARGLVTGFATDGIKLDTVNTGMRTRGPQLEFFARLANRPGNVDNLSLIYLFGYAGGNAAKLNVRQRNRSGEAGFSFGIDAAMRDSSIRASVFPSDPVLGYRTWNVNDGNFIEYHTNGEIYADLRFENAASHIRILPADAPDMPRGSVRVDVARLDISNMLELFPTAPPFGGYLNADFTAGMSGPIPAVTGTVGVDGLVYDGNNVGDVTASIVSAAGDSGEWNLGGKFDVDGKEAFNVRGVLSGENGGMDVAIDVAGFPLRVMDAFIPSDMVRVGGVLKGSAALRGTTARPDIDGSFNITDGTLFVPMFGTTFGISPQPLSITHSRLVMSNFGLTAPNRKPLAVEGSVDLGDLSSITASLDIYGDDFQIVNSPRGRGSQIAGTAYADIDISVRGTLESLAIRGDVDLLRSTDITYTMRESPLNAQIRRQDIVTFVSFADSAALSARKTPPAVRSRGMNVLLGIDIDRSARATVNLSENGDNRIELTGGGTLAFTINNQGDTRLTGRYVIADGRVVYNPPIISQKIFTITEDSHLEWNGEATNPRFSIRAVNAVPADIVMANGQTNRVNFNVIIKVENTLQDMSISFDLAAPANSDMQSELASLTPEQRSQQALALLAYGVYTGPGTSTRRNNLNANDLVAQQLNSFITREINQWARNTLPGVDLQVGAQTVNNADGGQHTRFSYSVSKSLFSDRVTVKVGGSVNDMNSENAGENLIDDISIEYRLTRRDNMFFRIFRHNTLENIFEGEITQTGVGFLLRKQIQRLGELFRLAPEQKIERRQRRGLRRDLRDEERRAARDMPSAAADTIPSDSVTTREMYLRGVPVPDSLSPGASPESGVAPANRHERRRPDGNVPGNRRRRHAGTGGD